jgi:hypothetical protein
MAAGRADSGPLPLDHQPMRCDHLQDTTTRYDPVAKLLTFLLICPVCQTEKVVETLDYEPRFKPTAA